MSHPSENIVLVDVRDSDEFARDHLDGAHNIPLKELEEQLPRFVSDKKTPVAFYCQGGMRAGRALEKARHMGYENAQNLGGIDQAREQLG